MLLDLHEQEHVFEFFASLNSWVGSDKKSCPRKRSIPLFTSSFSLLSLEKSKLGVMMKTSSTSSTKISEYHGWNKNYGRRKRSKEIKAHSRKDVRDVLHGESRIVASVEKSNL